jgi:hypothetical protein
MCGEEVWNIKGAEGQTKRAEKGNGKEKKHKRQR